MYQNGKRKLISAALLAAAACLPAQAIPILSLPAPAASLGADSYRADIAAAELGFGIDYAARGAPPAVSEPAPLSLLLLGAGVLMLPRRSGRSKPWLQAPQG